jgi:phospholipase C
LITIGGGFRVPCIIVSPWTAGGWVCTELFDRTSVPQFQEKFSGVIEPNISEGRRKAFADMVSAFRFNDVTAPPPQLPDTANAYSCAKYEAGNVSVPTLPGAVQKAPTQEKGESKRVPRK